MRTAAAWRSHADRARAAQRSHALLCGSLKPDEIRPGLWRWSAPHPEWEPTEDDGSPTAWARDVGCVLYETAEHAVFFDPLAAEDDAAFWSWADSRCRGREVVVLETIVFHRRSRDEFLARYSAATKAPQSACPPQWGVESYLFPVAEETVFWIPEHRALVPGDVLLGTGGGELALCPESWLKELSATPTLADLREALNVLRALEVELVLVSHGDPALVDGRAALARALEQT
jgi:hypothetical protein